MKLRSIKPILVAVALLLVGGSAVWADVLTTSVAFSSYDANGNGQGTGISSYTTIAAGGGHSDPVGTRENYEHRGSIEFDLTGITQTITSAFLVINPTSFNYNPGVIVQVAVYSHQGNGQASASLFQALDNYVGTQNVSYDVGHPWPVFQQDVTQAVQNAQANGWTTIGFTLLAPKFTQDPTQTFEWQVPNNPGSGQGTTYISYTTAASVPEPCVIHLGLAGAFVGLILKRCRRSRSR